MTWRILRNIEIEMTFFIILFFCDLQGSSFFPPIFLSDSISEWLLSKYSVCHILHHPGSIWLKNKCVKRWDGWNGNDLLVQLRLISSVLLFWHSNEKKDLHWINNGILITGFEFVEQWNVDSQCIFYAFVKIYSLFKLIFGLAINVWFDGNMCSK